MKIRTERFLELTEEEKEILQKANELAVEIERKLVEKPDPLVLKDFNDVPREIEGLYLVLKFIMGD